MITIPTLDEALDRLCARYCSECAQELARRGDPCPTCGALPELTRAEAAESLRAPGALADLAALWAREELPAQQAALSQQWAEADVLAHIAVLQRRSASAQKRLGEAIQAQKQWQAAVKAATRPDKEARARVADAEDALRRAELAEETARRTKARADAQADALAKVTACRTVLERMRADAAGPAERLREAENGLQAAREAVRQWEGYRDSAAAAAANPPPSVEPSEERQAGDMLLVAAGAKEWAKIAVLGMGENGDLRRQLDRQAEELRPRDGRVVRLPSRAEPGFVLTNPVARR